MTTPDQEPAALARLRDAHTTEQTARLRLDIAVADARAAGHTWQQIADTLAASRQAVWERFHVQVEAIRTTRAHPATG